ncbi:probable ATP-dependent RNA helicase DHX37 [Littorina saxatilis]|uniref:RNA helicase n=1 Tax=Littorina saxatilis TaxID=31220 RepID=A0AAN9AJ26_9CAEN
MGKTKQGHNWKARTQFKTGNDRSAELAQIAVDLPDVASDQYDDSNALALPGRKRKKKEDDEEVKPKLRKLTKKERKKLEKIKTQKEKKAKRADLLEKLQSMQASQQEMKLLTSISEVHSQRYKDKLKENKDEDDKPVNIIRGSNKLKKKQKDISDDDDDDDNDEGVESEAESIDTSDISTDEEDEESTEKKDKDEGDKPDTSEDKTEAVPTRAADEGMKTEGAKFVTGKNEDKKAEKISEPKPAVHIPVNRKPELQDCREKLPIYGEEQVIVELVNENPVTIISGETGSGKTTQVPQFLYEAGYAHGSGIIGVTEPRRVAAISMSKRVGEEMNLSSRVVSYQIRYEGNVTPDTRIKFMTDGVLLREIEQDFMLSKYSVIILDEAHERSVFTDILIGLLSRIAPYRLKKHMAPLKLIIMSATLDKVDFVCNPRLFRTKPAEIDVAARQFPVDRHFAHRTEEDYLAAAYKKICKIHQEEAAGGILIFVTGQQEVRTLCRKLKQTFPYKKDKVVAKPEKHESRKKRKKKTEEAESVLPSVDLSNFSTAPVDESKERMKAETCTLDTADVDDYDLDDDIEEIPDQPLEVTTKEPLWVLPLYSLLSTDKQNRVFEPPPPGCRLCVVATNVAETSLTIPNIYYVVDTGKTKTKFYDKVTGVSTFKVTWTSKASADQRMGRAGRVGRGKCFRLYSSAIFNNNFEEHSAAEMTRRPVDDLVLQMKAMEISKVSNFPFPTPPDSQQIQAAEHLLLSLGAVEAKPGAKVTFVKGKKVEPTYTITALGRTMAKFPVAPRYARMLAATEDRELLPYVIIAVAALSVDELFVDFQDADIEDDEAKQKAQRIRSVKRTWTDAGQSQLLGDLAMLIKAVGACESEGMSPAFCARNGIRYKAMLEIRKLRSQLTKEVNLKLPGVNLCIDPGLAPPAELQMLQLRKIVATGLADHVARLCPDPPPGTKDRHKHAYQCAELEDPVYIHPTSALCKQKKEFVVYQYIHQTTRQYMKGIVAIEPGWLPVLAPFHCSFSKPLEDPPPSWGEDTGKVMCHMKSTFGRSSWEMGEVRLEYPALAERYSWFARFLLEGKVVPELAKFTSLLLSLPSTMNKAWAKLQPRTEALKKALVARGVDSKKALLEEWNKDPQYLLTAYLQWLPESVHWQVADDWPPVSSS